MVYNGHNEEHDIQQQESPIPTTLPPPPPPLTQDLRNQKSYERSTGGKTTGFVVPFQTFEKIKTLQKRVFLQFVTISDRILVSIDSS